MKKRITITLLVTILAFLQATGCAPVEIEQPVPAAAIGSISATVTEVAALAPSSTAPPVPTKTPYPTTPTPDPALPLWTREPSPTPTVTAIPTATPLLLAGPVWRIHFRGQPCPDMHQNSGDCSKDSVNNILRLDPPVDYLINSDGSQLSSFEEAGLFLSNYRFFLLSDSFSEDGLRIAFLGSECVYVSDLSGNNPNCFAPYNSRVSGYRFLPDSNCLLVAYYYIFDDIEPPFAQVRIEKNCIGDETAEIIGVFDFVDLLGRRVRYKLSPQGDAVLAYGQAPDGTLSLYLQEILSPTPPLLLHAYPNAERTSSIVAARWLPDGSGIEFLLRGGYQSQEMFYQISRDGHSLTTGISLPEQFQVETGDWSPDGHQFAFSHIEEDRTKTGLYVVDLQTGEWRQILSGFHIIGQTNAWFIDTP